MAEIELTLEGIEELQESLASAIQRYPDLAEERLIETGKKFKKRVIQLTKESTTKKTGKLLKGYKLDKIRGYRMNMEQDFRGTAPHFHLVEKGHELLNKKGEVIGWVPGKFMVKRTRDEFGKEMPKVMEQLLEDMIRECGLDD